MIGKVRVTTENPPCRECGWMLSHSNECSVGFDELVNNLNPRAKLPRHFDLWSRPMQVGWLRQNQKKG